MITKFSGETNFFINSNTIKDLIDGKKYGVGTVVIPYCREVHVSRDYCKNEMEVSCKTDLSSPNPRIYEDPNYLFDIVPNIKNVVFNNPATIVFFDDGTKSVVKLQDEEMKFDETLGMAMAILKRVCGNNIYEDFKKYIWEKESSNE